MITPIVLVKITYDTNWSVYDEDDVSIANGKRLADLRDQKSVIYSFDGTIDLNKQVFEQLHNLFELLTKDMRGLVRFVVSTPCSNTSWTEDTDLNDLFWSTDYITWEDVRMFIEK